MVKPSAGILSAKMGLGLTNSGDDLRLQTELIAKTSSKVADSTLSVPASVWYIPDAVEHVPTCEQKNGDQAERSPQIAVL